MPKTRSLAWSELKIGIVAAIAVGLTSLLVVSVGGTGGFPWQQYQLKTRFTNVQGLKTGAVVRVAGVEVGKVDEIKFVGSEVEVDLKVNKDQRERIRTESRASIGSLSLLGEPVIDITPTTQGTPLEDGAFVPSVRAQGQLSDVAAGATESLEQATALLRDIRAGKGTVGKLFSDDQLYKEITAFVQAAEGVTEQPAQRRWDARPSDSRSGRLRTAQHIAGQPAGHHHAHQFRGRQPWPAPDR